LVVKLSDIKKLAPSLETSQVVVGDSTGKLVLSQLVDMDGDEAPDDLVFQADFAGNEIKTFTLQQGFRRPPAAAEFKVYGRFNRERHDDFAWENDRIGRRAYGPDLETWKKEPLTSSGIDVWAKRTRRLVINDWYQSENYHQDNGEGADFYSVGATRGCGGLGVWHNDKLFVSKNFTGSRVLANGPIRLVFELSYAPWPAGGVKVSETKRVILDAGHDFERYESTFKGQGAQPLTIGVGIARHQGGAQQGDKAAGTLHSWEPFKAANGNMGCGVVVAPSAVVDLKETDLDSLVVARPLPSGTLIYYAGHTWDFNGAYPDRAAWASRVSDLAREIAAPIRVTLAATKPTSWVQSAALPWSALTCSSVVRSRPEGYTDRWHYDGGFLLQACHAAGRKVKDKKLSDYAKKNVDDLIDAEGVIKGYKPDEYNIDHINAGKLLFTLLEETKDPKDKERYKKALQTLGSQMKTHPRTAEGAFWHKNVYPNQMWLDGVYMASPFLAQYARVFNEPELYDEVAKQILLAEKYMRDPKTGLLYHGWDESRKMGWSNPKTGTSPEFWGRAMGWYIMAIVDVLDYLPRTHPKRKDVIDVLRRTATALSAVQDKTTGVWWQVLDAGPREKNYLEASASSMFVYALSKGMRLGVLDKKTFGPVAERGWRGLIAQFVVVDANGQVNLNNVCKVAGLGGTPYRDGSYAYYTSTEIVANDPKGVAAFVMASLERE